jgi:hypothetical protein
MSASPIEWWTSASLSAKASAAFSGGEYALDPSYASITRRVRLGDAVRGQAGGLAGLAAVQRRDAQPHELLHPRREAGDVLGDVRVPVPRVVESRSGTSRAAPVRPRTPVRRAGSPSPRRSLRRGARAGSEATQPDQAAAAVTRLPKVEADPSPMRARDERYLCVRQRLAAARPSARQAIAITRRVPISGSTGA